MRRRASCSLPLAGPSDRHGPGPGPEGRPPPSICPPPTPSPTHPNRERLLPLAKALETIIGPPSRPENSLWHTFSPHKMSSAARGSLGGVPTGPLGGLQLVARPFCLLPQHPPPPRWHANTHMYVPGNSVCYPEPTRPLGPRSNKTNRGRAWPKGGSRSKCPPTGDP